MRYKDWLEISTTGFAQRQADRPPEHLLKEVIQNSLDATTGVSNGFVDVTIAPEKLGRKIYVKLTVIDNGPGINNPSDLRTVFSTGKTDSFLLRGRLGQGFKEILCLAQEAWVRSGQYSMLFQIKDGQRICDLEENQPDNGGTCVAMYMPWHKDVIPDLVRYLHSFIVPAGITMKINRQNTSGMNLPVEHTVPVELKTELFQDGKWVRRERAGTIHLVKLAFPGDTVKIFEMGIPVQEIDWTQPFHIDVQMRVPLNPRRDAVAAGYLKDAYRQILPVLMPKIVAQDLRDEWVSQAIEDAEPELRKDVVTQAFGADAVRSVPTLGKHDFDSDAREMGLRPIDTSLLPKGLRDAARETLRTSRDAELGRREAVFSALRKDANTTPREEAVRMFVTWLGSQLVSMPIRVDIVPTLVIDGTSAIAAWSPGGIIILNQAHRDEWIEPISERFFGHLAHEAAHERAPHHGDDFRKEVERMAGKLAMFCLENRPEVYDRWERALEEAIG